MCSFLFVAISVMALSAAECPAEQLYAMESHVSFRSEVKGHAAAGEVSDRAMGQIKQSGQIKHVGHEKRQRSSGHPVTVERPDDLQSYLELHDQVIQSGFGPGLMPWMQLRSVSDWNPDHADGLNETTYSPRDNTPDECS